jgi:hypothetical protein
MKALALTIATIGVATIAASLTARADEPLGSGITMYFQMGGNPGDGSTLPRTNGARAAAAAYGVKLVEQYSGWQPEKMLNQFKEALAASPGCIEIMGHPGNDAFAALVAERYLDRPPASGCVGAGHQCGDRNGAGLALWRRAGIGSPFPESGGESHCCRKGFGGVGGGRFNGGTRSWWE